MKALIIGGRGFLGWHLASRLHALHGVEAHRLGRGDLRDGPRLARLIGEADVVFHLAGVNRAATEDDIYQGNLEAAQALATAVAQSGGGCRIVYANSIQVRVDNAYGRAKAAAALVLAEAAHGAGGSFADVLLPNLFGEHGRPYYNSFVATFCHEVATGGRPNVNEDREVPLMHVQDAAEILISAADGGSDSIIEPAAEQHRVTDVLSRLQEFDALYRRAEVPQLLGSFDVDLFNTYRSFTFPDRFPYEVELHSDPRGDLFETTRSHGGPGQSFASITHPGQSRGNHFHMRKFERFFVVRGRAVIRLRRLLHDEIVTFEVSGERPALVDMPTLWTHSITNIGTAELVTVFWANQLLDPTDPDQYPEAVLQESPR